MLSIRMMIIGLLVAVLVGCSSAEQPARVVDLGEGAAPQETTPQEDSSSASSPTSNVVATVNGVAITASDFAVARARRQGVDVADSRALDREVLSVLIEQELINQGAASLGVEVTDEDIATEVATLKELAQSSGKDWEDWLRENNYSEAEVVADQQEILLTQRVRDALTEVYLGDVEQVSARHILVADLATANQVLAQLEAGGDFAALAQQFSRDATSNASGGDLGWFTRVELVDERLAEEAFNLEVGEIGGPVQTTLGYHLIQTLEKDTRPVDQQRLPLLQQSVFDAWLSSQYENAIIESFL